MTRFVSNPTEGYFPKESIFENSDYSSGRRRTFKCVRRDIAIFCALSATPCRERRREQYGSRVVSRTRRRYKVPCKTTPHRSDVRTYPRGPSTRGRTVVRSTPPGRIDFSWLWRRHARAEYGYSVTPPRAHQYIYIYVCIFRSKVPRGASGESRSFRFFPFVLLVFRREISLDFFFFGLFQVL